METQKITNLVASPNIQGNIGSCEVKKVEYNVDSWHSGVILQDSCSGKIVGQHEYYNWGYLYFSLVVIIIFVAICLALKALFD